MKVTPTCANLVTFCSTFSQYCHRALVHTLPTSDWILVFQVQRVYNHILPQWIQGNSFPLPNRNTGWKVYLWSCESHPAKPYTPYTHHFTSCSLWLHLWTGSMMHSDGITQSKTHQHAALAVNETSTSSGSSSHILNVHSKHLQIVTYMYVH